MALVVAVTLLTFVFIFGAVYGLVEWVAYLSERRTYRTTMGQR